MTTDTTWRVWVTAADVRAARVAWIEARESGAPPERVLDLLQELDRLSCTLAYQAAGDTWPTGAEAATDAVVPSFTTRRFLRPAARLSVAG